MKKLQQKILAILLPLVRTGYWTFAYLSMLARPSYWKIRNSGIFDPVFYLETNPDLAGRGVNPLVHYLHGGWRERRSPHILFDIGYYLRQISEDQGGAGEPIIHFISEGWRQGKKPSPYFDPLEYAREKSDTDFSTTNPLSHFIGNGCREGKYLPPYIDRQFYVEKYPDVAESGVDPLIHYFTTGRRELRQPSLFFDVGWYMDRAPLLQGIAENILMHYFLHGVEEGKSPIPVFDRQFYLTTYADAVGEEKDLLAHYLRQGERQGYRPCAWFDPVFYRQTYLKGATSLALGHFLAEGVHSGVYPNREVMELLEKPVISVIVPVYNVAAQHLNNCIRSVVYQSYPHWQLCLADDCSTQPHVKPLVEEWAKKDARIRVVFLSENSGISGATNEAASLAGGDYLGFLDNDDELAPECLFKIAEAINKTAADLLYTDEDLIGDDGRRFAVFYKPDYNRELLLCHNYITHFVVTAARLFDRVGGVSVDMTGAQDHDLFLKLSECAKGIVHIPETLYHWRASETSTSINHQQKEYADAAGRLAIAAAVDRRGLQAKVLPTDLKFFYRTQRELCHLPLVSVVIYWDQQDEEPKTWLENLVSITDYTNYEILLLHDDEVEMESIHAHLTTLDQPVKTLAVAGLLGLAKLYNLAVERCDGEYIAFLSSDVVITEGTWLSSLVEYCQEPDVAAVFGTLQCNNERLVEPTPLPDISNRSAWYYSRYIQQASILLNGLQCPQNTWMVVWECCLVQKEALDHCGGFADGIFPDLFAIHDLCLQFHEKGLQMYYTPYCAMAWRADARRFDEDVLADHWTAEMRQFKEKWHRRLRQGDPFFNRGKLQEANIQGEDFRLWFGGDNADG